jgi:cation diffusion facilitator family transporter
MADIRQNFRIQRRVTALISVLFLIKIAAWYVTHSVAVLTDALEYTINVITGFIGLYSLNLSSLPKDRNHPYGHGKVEFISASAEGTLMIVSGLLIVYEAIDNLYHPHTLHSLDSGILLVVLTGLMNLAAGLFVIRKGKAGNSLALTATGRHMLSDAWATGGIVTGLILIRFTGYVWIDSIVAFIFALIILFSGYKILRSSIAGIMDEADEELIREMVEMLQKKRRPDWIDLHNLRIIKYGSTLHLDCHLTIPWFFNIHQGHAEVDALESMVREEYGSSVELFVHTDGCMDFSCAVCDRKECPVRQGEFIRKIDWTVANISGNSKHRID